jgi:hypothetical protein
MKKQKSQLAKFIEAAKDTGASASEQEFDRMLDGIARAPPPETVQDRKPQKAKKPTK